ncbi:hypothetical protein [Cohnella zeiphila]|uniref:Uncharacterized protein n=1 Tax=Cohnella zeiphila TaxID=2761120 RepID=A0A7X0SHK2_9BACL|nr:hypothetical protein [Cohnella zeiphila]MBB6730067.1 hypothetical protein [Cohnella zeiphila]
MQYYLAFTDDGNIAGFYVDEIHGDNIPAGAVPITDEQWRNYNSDACLYMRDESGREPCRLKTQQELDDEAATMPPPPKTLEQLQLEQQQQALDDLTLAFADLLAK